MNESMDLVAYIFLGIAFVYLEFRMRTKVNDQRKLHFHSQDDISEAGSCIEINEKPR